MKSLSRHHILRSNKKIAFELQLIAISSFGPLATIPQILKIWQTESAEDISIITWSIYLVTSLMWVAYALKIKSKPLLFNNVLWVAVEMLVVAGVFKYS